MSASLEHVTYTIRSAKFAALDIVQEFLLLERLVDHLLLERLVDDEGSDVASLVGDFVDQVNELVIELNDYLTELVK